MQLKNPFSNDTRNIYLYTWTCWVCGGNGVNRGGLALHHIYGRISASPLNSSLVCGYCHVHMGHSMDEQHNLLRKTINFLSKEGYKLKPIDDEFLVLISYSLRSFRL